MVWFGFCAPLGYEVVEKHRRQGGNRAKKCYGLISLEMSTSGMARHMSEHLLELFALIPNSLLLSVKFTIPLLYFVLNIVENSQKLVTFRLLCN